jgi:hypothetical protein
MHAAENSGSWQQGNEKWYPFSGMASRTVKNAGLTHLDSTARLQKERSGSSRFGEDFSPRNNSALI